MKTAVVAVVVLAIEITMCVKMFRVVRLPDLRIRYHVNPGSPLYEHHHRLASYRQGTNNKTIFYDNVFAHQRCRRNCVVITLDWRMEFE